MAAPEKATPGGSGQASAEEKESSASLPEAEAWRAAVAQRDKIFATMRAQFALRGFELTVISEDGAAMFIVRKYGMVRSVRTLAELEQFAARIGVAA